MNFAIFSRCLHLNCLKQFLNTNFFLNRNQTSYVSLWISSEDNEHKCIYLEACMALLNQLKWHSNLSRIRLISGLILFLHEQRGEQGLLKIQAIDNRKFSNPMFLYFFLILCLIICKRNHIFLSNRWFLINYFSSELSFVKNLIVG